MINQDRYRKERLALTGMIVVVILLLAYCIGTLIVLWQTSTQINQNIHLLDMYQEAHYLARAEDAVADEYYLNSGHLFRQEYYSNVADLANLFTALIQQDPANRTFLLSLQQAQAIYVSRATQYFSMVDTSNPHARSFYNTLVDPLAATLNARLLTKVKTQQAETHQLLARNQMLQQSIALLFLLFFALGLGMLVLFGRNILRYRRELANARQMAWELTLQKRAEEAERRAQSELDRKKDEFVCMASHELRTPLTSLKGNLQLAQRRLQGRLGCDTSLLSETEKALFAHLVLWNERALRQVNVECRLVDDLLDVNQIRSEGLHMSLSTDNLVQVVRHAVDDMRVMAQDHPLRFETPASPEIPARIDRVRIGQVVTHYTSNAFRYSDEQQPVLVGIKLEANEAQVWVKDAGPGLSLEAQRSLWDRFQQVSGHMGYTTPGSCGLGLGLYLCQEIVRLHGGRIGVESVMGVGSTFWFTLPIIQPEESYPHLS